MLIAPLLAAVLMTATAPQAGGGPDAEVTLERTACFGTCPVYSVRIAGDGLVEYAGKQYVRVVGAAQGRITRTAVQQLLDLIQKSGYFEMAGEYRYLIGPDGTRGTVTDLPTTITSVRIGTRTHRIVDYVGAPDALHEIERAIDRTAGTAKWVHVDRQAVEELVRGGWSARTKEGAAYLRSAAERGDADTVDALLLAGADPNTPPLGPLALTRDVDVSRRLIEGGADVNAIAAGGETVLTLTVRTGNADKVRLLIEAGALVNAANTAGQTPLQLARDGLNTPKTAPRFVDNSLVSRRPMSDYATIIRLLLAAGAKDR